MYYGNSRNRQKALIEKDKNPACAADREVKTTWLGIHQANLLETAPPHQLLFLKRIKWSLVSKVNNRGELPKQRPNHYTIVFHLNIDGIPVALADGVNHLVVRGSRSFPGLGLS